MRLRRLSIGLCILALAGCTGTTPTPSESESSRPRSQGTTLETHNVSYRGTVHTAGVNLYMEGTHRLELASGKSVYLESATVDLDGYIGDEVEVSGTVRPTVEGDATIMEVENVQSFASSVSSVMSSKESSSEVASSVSSESSSEDVSSSAASSVTSVAASSMKTSSSVVTSSSVKTSSSVATASSSSNRVEGDNSEKEARAELMAKENLISDRWTQQYCSTHIGLCFPVHKNWWFKSFGATTSYLWHVEVSASEINNLGDGPLVVNILAGALSGASDGEVKMNGDWVIGYKAWKDGRHVEISAPASLAEAVRYITSHMTEATE